MCEVFPRREKIFEGSVPALYVVNVEIDDLTGEVVDVETHRLVSRRDIERTVRKWTLILGLFRRYEGKPIDFAVVEKHGDKYKVHIFRYYPTSARDYDEFVVNSFKEAIETIDQATKVCVTDEFCKEICEGSPVHVYDIKGTLIAERDSSLRWKIYTTL